MDPTRPLLIFAPPELVDRPKGRGGGSLPPKPQDSYLYKDRIHERIKNAINFVQDSPGDLNHVLVIETVGKLQDFHKAVEKIEGLEWLGEFDVDDVDEVDLSEIYKPDSDNYKEAKKLGGRWYLSSSNKQALKDLLRKYNKFKSGVRLGHGYGVWEKLFTYVSDLRFWNEKDRLEDTGIIDKWKEDIKVKSETNSKCNFEIELHSRKNKTDANNDQAEIRKYIEEQEGTIGKIYRNPEIAFHAMKISLPIAAVESLLEAHQKTYQKDHQKESGYPQWIRSSAIKYCRPIGQQLQEDIHPEAPENFKIEKPQKAPPVTALLDGMPLRNHELIRDFIDVDDPDLFSEKYEPSQHKHGTAMASLICHGDLSQPGRKSIQRKIYVRPIMHPNDEPQKPEKVPFAEFMEDLIEKAIVRIKEGVEGSKTAYPSIKIINLSIGVIDREFLREMSPLSRMIDFLSWKYKLLFIVSAGNYYSGNITVSDNNANVVPSFIHEIQEQKIKRKLLSPAESLNSLTVGAMQDDHSPSNLDGLRNPYENLRLPAEYSRNGPGFRDQIKPDILLPGGKLLYKVEEGQWSAQKEQREIGQKTASVGINPEELNYTTHTSGTSNAAASATHAAAHLYEVIASLESEGNTIPEDYYALVLKSLLVHGASWGDMCEQYEILVNEQNSRKRGRLYANHLGYGEADFERVMSCTKERATMIGFGTLSQKKRHRFRLSMPTGFGGLHLRLIATLTWFTPINPFRYGYRQAKLFFDISYPMKVKRKEADWQQVRKGTVQHEIFDVSEFAGEAIELCVQCESDAVDNLEEKIPYAISFTIEAAEETLLDIYGIIVKSMIKQKQPIKVSA